MLPCNELLVNRSEKFVACHPKVPLMENRRIEIGLGDADQFRLGGRLAFGPPHVRPAAEQLGRHARWPVPAARWGCGPRPAACGGPPAACPSGRRAGFPPAAGRFPVAGWPRPSARGWPRSDGRPRASSCSRPFPPLGPLEHQFQDGHVLPQIAEPFLVGADLDVVGGHVAQQRDEHLVVIGHRGVEVVVGRRDGAAEPAPKIELPGQVEAEVPLVEERRATGLGP